MFSGIANRTCSSSDRVSLRSYAYNNPQAASVRQFDDRGVIVLTDVANGKQQSGLRRRSGFRARAPCNHESKRAGLTH